MKITVLNGSPKGDISVTRQYVKYLEKHFTAHKFKILNISQKIKNIEKNKEIFNGIMDEIKLSDGVLWACPLYYFLVPAQYKRFIELIYERKKEGVFENKYAAVPIRKFLKIRRPV